jgi:large subunit ribosomal protein L1
MSKEKNINQITASNLEDAIEKIQELAKTNSRKFVESVDIAVGLGIDAKQSDQSVKGSIVLPSGSGKKVKVLVFSANEEIKKASLEAGAAFVGLEDMMAKIEEGFLDFDCCIATPDVMQKISKVAKKLGPRGLMPSPKNGTVTNDVNKAIEDALKGKVNFKNDKTGIVHCAIGDFKKEELLTNIKAVIRSIKDSKPEASKGKYIKNFYINTTMGPAVKVSVDSLN